MMLLSAAGSLTLSPLRTAARAVTEEDPIESVVFVPVALAKHPLSSAHDPTRKAPANPTPVDRYNPVPMPPDEIFWNCTVEEDYDRAADGELDRRSTTVYDGLSHVLRHEVDNSVDGTIDRISTYIYDEATNLELVQHDVDNDGSLDRTTRYFYDARNRQVREEYDTNADGVPNHVVLRMYDDQDNLLQREEDNGADGSIDNRRVHDYVDGLRLRTENDLNNDGRIDSRTDYEWDSSTPARLVRKMSYDAPSWHLRATVEYTYDDVGRLIQEYDVGRDWTNYLYQEDGWLSKVKLYRDGVLHDTLDYTYDPWGRLLRTQYRSGAYRPYTYSYRYACPRN